MNRESTLCAVAIIRTVIMNRDNRIEKKTATIMALAVLDQLDTGGFLIQDLRVGYR